MLVATLLSLFASPAHALSPAYGFGEVRPLDGSAQVATTVMPVVEALGLTLTAGDAEGEFAVVLQEVGTDAVVPAEVEAIGAGLYQIIPDDALAAETTYAVQVPGFSSDGAPLTQFTTGVEADGVVPTIPQPVYVDQVSTTDEWGDWHAFSITQRPAVDPVGVIYTVEVESVACALAGDCGAPPVSFALGGATHGEPAHDGSTVNEVLGFHTNPAAEWDPLATLVPDDSVVRITTMDLSGNPAPLVCSVPPEVDPETVGCGDAAMVATHSTHTPHEEEGWGAGELEPEGEAGGCSVTGATPALALALMSMGVVARRRER